MSDSDLPELIELEDYNGDWDSYIDAVYELFKRDYVDNSPHFRGTRLGIKRHPEIDNREYTFYHMTHTGNDEDNRKPDLRRCERIPWGKPTIENCDDWDLKVWEQKRNGEQRICIWLEMEDGLDYVIILNKRRGYLLPWTAFVMKHKHQKKKKLKEYKKWLEKAKGA